MSVTVIVPTYNESENIAEVLRRIKSAQPLCRILVVDDGSPDGTADVADRIAVDSTGIVVVRRTSKNGLGSAYRFAFERIFAEQDFDEDDTVITMDADLSHDPAVIPLMVGVLSRGADVVIGSRYVPGGGTENWPLHRRLLSRWGNRYTSWILGVAVGDCTSGFRAYRAGALRSIEPQSTNAEGYAFLTELILRLHGRGFRIEEVPIRFVDRTAGTSKMSGRIILESMTLVTKWGIHQRFLRPTR